MDDEQESFPADLTLHSDHPTPDELPCTAANAVEVHRDSQSGEGGVSQSKVPLNELLKNYI